MDASRDEIAVLDSKGMIVAVNDAWDKFALENAVNPKSRHNFVGWNYLSVCARDGIPVEERAGKALAGVLGVLAGQLPRFSMEYPCHSPRERRWFEMTVTRLHGSAGAICSHRNITRRRAVEDPAKGLESPGDQTSRKAAQPIRVALIDDNKPLLGPLRALLERRGYDVAIYADPAAVIEALREDPDRFELVVSDYRMPGMTGVELLTALRVINPDLPTGIISASIDATVRSEAAAAGVDELIPKGRISDLYTAVDRLAGRVKRRS